MTGCRRCRQLIDDSTLAYCPHCGEPLHDNDVVLQTDVALISNALQTQEQPLPEMVRRPPEYLPPEYLPPDTSPQMRFPPPEPDTAPQPMVVPPAAPAPVRDAQTVPQREVHLVVLLGRAIVAEYRFHGGVITIGRDPRQDVVLENPSVSRLHCKIRYLDDGRAVVEDMETPNGTTLNRLEVRRAELSPDDEIGVGKFVVLYRPGAQRLALLEARQRARVSEPSEPGETCFLSISEVHRIQHDQVEERGPHIKVMNPGGRMGRRISLNRGTTVLGRSMDADIQLHGWFIHDRHALIVQRPQGHRLIHNAGFRPVWVNGRPVRECTLHNHDEIRIGGNSFSFFDAV